MCAVRVGLAFLEVDERLFIDGGRSPVLHGTGLEDYFNCGWYYQGGQTLNLPCHGIPVRRLLWGEPYNYATTYRHHLSDVLPFEQEVRVLFENVPYYMPSDLWRSVTYYYKLPGAASGLRRVAEIDPGDPASEAAFAYSVSGSASLRTDAWRFPGRQPFEPLTYTGRRIENGVRFTVPLESANAGVLLRRLIDAGIGGQGTKVFVDGEFVGDWVWPDHQRAALYAVSNNRSGGRTMASGAGPGPAPRGRRPG